MKKTFLSLCFIFAFANVYSKNCWCGRGSIRFDWQVAKGEKCSSGIGAATMTFTVGDHVEISHTSVGEAQSYCGL